MAGSHNVGIEHASAELFYGAPYAMVTDSTRQPGKTLTAIEDVIRAIGAIPVRVTAEEHDRTVARVSHVPQLIATALACAVSRRTDTDLRLVGSGFSDIVRLAASQWSVWEDICRTNADEITLALDELIGEMEAVRSSIGTGDLDGTGKAFGDANALIENKRLFANERIDSRRTR
jgi:prephenate dehydrogenase